jgi:hypothetical protein
MQRDSEYKLRKRIKQLERDLELANNALYVYRTVMGKLFTWLTAFAKKESTGNPNPEWGLNTMKELFR